MWPKAAACGTAVTVLAQRDNWMLRRRRVVGRAHRRRQVTTQNDDGMFDLLATSYRARGAWLHRCRSAGRELAEMQFPVGRARSAHATVKATLGSVNVPVMRRHAGQPGDVIVADDDGVVVVPRADAGLRRCGRGAREEEGEPCPPRRRRAGIDIYGMRDTLAKAGLKYID
jgi:4-hydroxy-4-methyl-2-oxoglutarate aldolase